MIKVSNAVMRVVCFVRLYRILSHKLSLIILLSCHQAPYISKLSMLKDFRCSILISRWHLNFQASLQQPSEHGRSAIKLLLQNGPRIDTDSIQKRTLKNSLYWPSSLTSDKTLAK